MQYDDNLYVAGQIGLVPHTMQIKGDSVVQEARLSLQHVDSILQAMKSDLNKLKSCVCYVTDNRYISSVKHVLVQNLEHFDEKKIVFIEVDALPRQAKVEWQFVSKIGSEEIHEYMKVSFKKIATDYDQNRKNIAFKEAACHLFKTIKFGVEYGMKTQIKLFYVANNAEVSYVDCLVQKYVNEVFKEISIKPEVLSVPVKSLYYINQPRHMMICCHSICDLDKDEF